MQGTNYQIDKGPILDLPILKADQSNENTIATIVSKIIDALRLKVGTELEGRVLDFERQIDQLVYKLYGLTLEEIALVEENS